MVEQRFQKISEGVMVVPGGLKVQTISGGFRGFQKVASVEGAS